MFCNYCGNPNPDEAAFCAKCGKPIAHAAATPSQPSAAPVAPAPQQPVARPPAAAAAAPPVAAPPPAVVAAPPIVVAAPPVAVAPQPKKKRRSHWFLILFTLFVLFVLLYPHKDGNTICTATQQEVVQQVPYAVDILAARHPLMVGLLRSEFNQNGAVDKIAEDYFLSNMQSHNPSAMACYTTYYAIMFNKDGFRSALADSLDQQLDSLEKQFGLSQ